MSVNNTSIQRCADMLPAVLCKSLLRCLVRACRAAVVRILEESGVQQAIMDSHADAAKSSAETSHVTARYSAQTILSSKSLYCFAFPYNSPLCGGQTCLLVCRKQP